MKSSEDDRRKVITCITLMHKIATDPSLASRDLDLLAECRRRLGAGWSLMAVTRYRNKRSRAWSV